MLAMASFQAIDVSTDPPLSSERRPQQAGSYRGSYLSKHLCISLVGASLLAMDANDNAGCLNERVVQSLFASKPAPTVDRIYPNEYAFPL